MLLIRDGFVIGERGLPHTDLLIDGDTIVAVGAGLPAEGEIGRAHV